MVAALKLRPLAALGKGCLLAFVIVSAVPPIAHADVASDISADLQISGVPNPTVTVQTPTAASVGLETLAGQPLTLDAYKPYFSPDYRNPRAIARISVAVAPGNPLSGIITTPGFSAPPYTDLAPKLILWRLAALDAVKHAVANGAILGGWEFAVQVTGAPTPSRSITVVPDNTTFPPSQTFVTKMPVDAVRQAVQLKLPPWAANASISVVEDRAGERVVTATLQQPVQAFAVHDVRQLPEALAGVQASLVTQGGDIGRTIVKIADSTTADPLYVSADDRSWGYQSRWQSPLVAGLVAPPSAPGAADGLLSRINPAGGSGTPPSREPSP